MRNGFLAEKKLQELNPQLHSQYRNCIVVSHRMLQHYESTFPHYTDHSTLHALEVIEHCNALIGAQIDRLTAEDLYVLLMGALFHDVGMGVSEKDFRNFCGQSAQTDALITSQEDFRLEIRNRHHTLSAQFVEKYWQLLDIPSEAYATAIGRVCSGHRKTDLYDRDIYPDVFFVEKDRGVALPYLAALIRLADELDIAADRNSMLLFELEKIDNELSRSFFKSCQGIRSVEILADRIAVTAESEEPQVCAHITEIVSKVAEVLSYCRDVVADRTVFTLRQDKVELFLNEQQVLL